MQFAHRVVVLPGMHGTTALFDDLAATAPTGAELELVELPNERLGYEGLAARLAPNLRLDSQTVLVAESFSGPLAIILAERHQVAALVLCNTFATPPYPRALSTAPLSLLARIPPPDVLVRHYIVGPRASNSLVAQVRASVDSVRADLLGFRARCALTVDVTAELARCSMPILYLRGSEDHLVRERSVKAIVAGATVPVQVTRIPAPHLLLKTHAAEAWDAIGHFLDRSVDT